MKSTMLPVSMNLSDTENMHDKGGFVICRDPGVVDSVFYACNTALEKDFRIVLNFIC